MIHIGEEIRKELVKQERSTKWLADKINCERTNIYKIFKRESIDSEQLAKISIALNRNFFDLYDSYLTQERQNHLSPNTPLNAL